MRTSTECRRSSLHYCNPALVWKCPAKFVYLLCALRSRALRCGLRNDAEKKCREDDWVHDWMIGRREGCQTSYTGPLNTHFHVILSFKNSSWAHNATHVRRSREGRIMLVPLRNLPSVVDATHCVISRDNIFYYIYYPICVFHLWTINHSEG